jgi:hypothetical protein
VANSEGGAMSEERLQNLEEMLDNKFLKGIK